MNSFNLAFVIGEGWFINVNFHSGNIHQLVQYPIKNVNPYIQNEIIDSGGRIPLNLKIKRR